MSLSGGQRMVGKIALVTGAASGIGRAIAQRMAAEGARVVLADLNEPGTASVADAIQVAGGEAMAVPLAVSMQ
jgi:NAD(P)-dependent dehydrogenase (short-subunit alcohol dehydrogenase family)